jgi:hypothetical protein
MRDERNQHTEHEPPENRTENRGQWPGPAPAAERKADEVRENLMGAGPQTAATGTRPDTAQAASRERGPGPVPAPERAGPARADSAPGRAATDTSAWLFEPAHSEEFRRRWDAIKASFVDDPREAVRRADELTDELMRELTATVESRRHDLAERWRDSGTADDETETERLRLALHGYRNMLDPILRV